MENDMTRAILTKVAVVVCTFAMCALVPVSGSRVARADSQSDSMNLPKHEGVENPLGISSQALGAGSFSTFYTFRGNGIFPALRFLHPSISSNSRVFVNISEFTTDAVTTRFIGAARLAVFNVAPFNGGFFAWVEVPFNFPLNVRFDVLVDP